MTIFKGTLKLMFPGADYLESLGIPPMLHDKLSDIVAYDEDRKG